MDRRDFRATPGEVVPSPASLTRWLTDQGLWAKAVRLSWKRLVRISGGAPVVLLFNDGGAGLLIAADRLRNVVWIKDPLGTEADIPVAVDELRLSEVWDGEALLVRRQRGESLEEAPFNMAWLVRLVLRERKLLTSLSIAGLVLSVLTVMPTLLVMSLIDEVLQHNSMNSLIMLSLIFLIVVVWETILGHSKRELTQVIATRIDTRLNLHVFNRLQALTLDYFERNQVGAVTHRITQIFKIRDFLTGKMVNTVLDFCTLIIILPILFWLNATMAWMVLAGSCLIALVILVFLPALRQAYGELVRAEVRKGSVLVETIHGIRTVKTLALEPSRSDLWDERVAEASGMRLRVGRLGNWPETLINPIERFVERGVVFVGVGIALSSGNTFDIGSVVGFILLGSRCAAPLVNLAKLIGDFEEVRASILEVQHVLNNPTESRALKTGLRPTFKGAISFDDVSFTYPLAKSPALDRVTFAIEPGTMLGVVGKSGSGKSTLTRLLQGINRTYTGFLKIDGADLREINLTHLRRSFGVVLQDNFLFRGSVKDNIIAGRPGLTITDAVRAARLAGAEEFIERLPAGYDTFVEEGSTNLSGGQRQRLAIARALISDPKIMILDEATSALDPESEALVNANLQRIGKGRTMVIVSHRLSSLVDCDQILVMEKGRVADIGPHRVLLERCTTYRQLWMQQNRHLEGGGMPRSTGLKPVLAEGDD
ncbi:MAG TPA: peptidase domain-containing ABC transporter [Acetobacteraceae bacterium]|nr:peptidase domain-containing ABC transporter [Acetobacteraceae bacterium]